MNALGKMRTKKMVGKLLAFFAAVALVASSFLMSAVWATADTTSPAGTHYNVVMDADDVNYLAWKFADGSAGSVSAVADHSYEGNAYKWFRGDGSVNSSSIVDVALNKSGYTDETAVVFYIDATGQIAANVNYTFMLNTVTATGESCFKLTAGNAVFALATDGELYELASGDQTIPVAKDFVGWYIIPFESFSRHWGTDETFVSGSVTTLRLTTGTNWNSVLYLDDFGFTADAEAFLEAAMTGTLVANRPAADDGDEGDEPGGETGGDNTGDVSGAHYTVAMDADGAKYTKWTFADGSAGSVSEVTGHGYSGKAYAWNRGGSGGASTADVTFAATGKDGETAVVVYIDATGQIANKASYIFMLYANAASGQTCFKLQAGKPIYTVAADGTAGELACTDQKMPVQKGFVGWYIIPFTSFAKHWGSVDAIPSGTVASLRLSTDTNYSSVLYLDDFGFATDVDAFKAAAVADTLVANRPGTSGEEGGDEGGDTPGGDTPGGNTPGEDNSVIAQDFEGTVEIPDGAGKYEIVDSDNGKALKLLRGADAIKLGKVPFNAVGTADQVALAFWYDATNTGFTDGISFSLIPRVDAGKGGITLATGYPVTTVINGTVTKDDTTIVSGNFTFKPKAGTKGWIIVEIPKAGSENKMWSFDGDGTYTGTMENMACVELGIPYFTNSSIVLDEFTFVSDVDAFIAAGCQGEAPEGGDQPGGDQPATQGDFTAVMDFDNVSWITNKNEDAAKLKADNGLGGSKGMLFDRGQAGGGAFAEIYFATTGNTADEAYVFYADGSALPSNFSLVTCFYDPGRCLKPTIGEAAYLVAEDGTKTEVTINSGYGVTIPQGFKGWVVIPFSSITYAHWGNTPDVEPPVAGSVNGIYLGSADVLGSTLNLDEFGFTADMDAFMTKAAAGTLSSNYGPVGTPGGDSGEGGDDGDEPGDDIPGDDDGVDTTVIAQDFEGTVELPEDAAGKYEIVDSVNGKAFRFFRETSPITIKSVPFNEIGTADHQYLAFWYDATGCAEKFYFNMIPRDTFGNGITIASAHPVITVVDGVVKKNDTTIVHSNFSFRPATGSKGWIIFEINDQGEGDRIWRFDGDAATYTGTMENLAAVELRLPEFHNSSIVVDQFTLVDDLPAFLESIGGNTPGGDTPGGDQPDDPYVPDTSNPSPSDYNLAVDFDEKKPLDIKHEGGGFAVEDPEISFSGNALLWDRGTDSAYANTTATITFDPTGYSDENAIVFWYEASGINASHNFTFCVYDKGGADGATQCLSPKADAVYRTISADGKIKDLFVPSENRLKAEKNFAGWVVVPFTSLKNHWHPGVAASIKPGTVFQIMVQHDNTFGNQIVIDNIGFTHNMDNFAEKAAAGTLNQGGPVEPGNNVLPMPDGAGTSDKVLTGGPDGATADNEFFHTAVNFNSKAPIALTTPQNAYVKLVQESKSGYGSGLNWFKNTTSEPTNITFVMENGQATDTGIALWISTKDSGNGFATKIRFMPHDKKDGTERCWRLVAGSLIYLVQDGTVEEARIDTKESLTVPGGFEGWAIIPYEAFEHHWGRAAGDDDAAVENYVIDPATVYVLDLYYGNASVTKGIEIDEIGYFSDMDQFALTLGQFAVKPIYDQPFQSMDVTFGEGGLADAPGEGVLAWTDSKNTTLELSGDYCNDGYALYVDTKGNAELHIAIDTGEEYGVVDPSVTAGYTGIAFWVYTEGAGTDLALKLKLADGRIISVDPKDLSKDFYRLVDENTFDTTAHAYDNGIIHVPDEFQGWVVVDTCAYGGSDWDMSMVTEMILDIDDEIAMYLDTFRTGSSAVSLLMNRMNFPMDDDLILSADAGKVVIEEQEDGTKVINLYQDGLTSGQFRKVAIVRAGYRVIYRDAQNRQLFGSVSDMADVVKVQVLLGSIQQAEYTLAIDGVIPGGNSPDTGDAANLWVYVLAAAMLSVVTVLGTVTRKAVRN
ncbi:MAG: hypothetical protein IJ518_03360 [Clostridia bacterium]|nr:hypothetical protein [Clostridia bacterium]